MQERKIEAAREAVERAEAQLEATWAAERAADDEWTAAEMAAHDAPSPADEASSAAPAAAKEKKEQPKTGCAARWSSLRAGRSRGFRTVASTIGTHGHGRRHGFVRAVMVVVLMMTMVVMVML